MIERLNRFGTRYVEPPHPDYWAGRNQALSMRLDRWFELSKDKQKPAPEARAKSERITRGQQEYSTQK